MYTVKIRVVGHWSFEARGGYSPPLACNKVATPRVVRVGYG